MADEYETPELAKARELSAAEGITVAAAMDRLRIKVKEHKSKPAKANMAVPPGSTESI